MNLDMLISTDKIEYFNLTEHLKAPQLIGINVRSRIFFGGKN